MTPDQFIEALRNAVLFGVSLTAIVVTVIQAAKDKFPGFQGPVVKWVAIGFATLIGSLYLIYNPEFGLPAVPFDYGARIAAALIWAFLTPEFYDLLKGTSAKGVGDHIQDAEEKVFAEARGYDVEAEG